MLREPGEAGMSAAVGGAGEGSCVSSESTTGLTDSGGDPAPVEGMGNTHEAVGKKRRKVYSKLRAVYDSPSRDYRAYSVFPVENEGVKLPTVSPTPSENSDEDSGISDFYSDPCESGLEYSSDCCSSGCCSDDDRS